MAAHSKLTSISTSCVDLVHPWTESCTAAAAGYGVSAFSSSIRMYAGVYVLSLLARGKKPTINDIIRTALTILQSTAFLTFHGISYTSLVCLVRNVLGKSNIWTIIFLPAFISSGFSILIERPSRRSLLAAYMTNLATETWFRMAVNRGWLSPIRHGEVYIFMASIAAVMYYYKAHEAREDSLNKLLRFVVGPYEEKGYKCRFGSTEEESQDGWGTSAKSSRSSSWWLVNRMAGFVEPIRRKLLGLGKHHLCLHPHSCAHNTLEGTIKLFSISYLLQGCLHLLSRLSKIVRNPRTLSRELIQKDAFLCGAFLGGFAGVYRMVSCLLRYITNNDSAVNAIPAALIAGMTFSFYPVNTIALYFMLKSLQISYNRAVDLQLLPRVPGLSLLLYCLSSATVVHASMVEPNTLRPSYWRFIHSFSGGRTAATPRGPYDAFGLETSRQLAEAIITGRTPIIKIINAF